MRSGRINQYVAVSVALGLLALSQAGAGPVPANSKPKVRLFILAGQSNMEKLDESKSFTPAIKKAFPGDEVIVVKYAVGATPIRLWFKGWKAPEGADESWTKDMAQQGSLYDKLMEKVQEAIKGKTPDTVSFVWMQGERDAKGGVSASYETGLRGLIGKVREDMKRDDVTVVIGRLSTHLRNDKHWEAIRAIQEKVATDDPRGAWVNTDGLNGPKNGVHYTEEGYVELGRLFAGKTIALLSQAGVPVEREAAWRSRDGARKALAFVQKSAPRPEQAAALAALERRFAAAVTASAVDWKGLAEDADTLRRRTILSHPALNFDDLLFVERDILVTSPGYRPTTDQGPFYDGEQAMDQCFGHNARKGGGLYLLKGCRSDAPQRVDLVRGLRVPSGTNQGLLLSEGAFMSPALSYDGKTVLFAWASGGQEKWKQANRFNIFRVNVDGSGLARLTDGDYDDFDPCWLPDGHVVFISTRRGGFCRCGPRPVPTYTLFGMHADGSAIRCLSYHETNEWQPSVDHNGMLVYTRWDYVDRDAMIAIHPWICYPDGRNPRAVHGNYPLPLTTVTGADWPDGRALRPLCEHGFRAIPNSWKYVGVATPHHNQSYGSLILVDPRVEDDSRMSQVRRLTPEVKFPEIEQGELAYGTPWPLSEELYLCNYKDSLCVLYFPDEQGVREPLYVQKNLRPIAPIPVQARAKPHTIPPQTYPAAPPGMGTLYVQNVYLTDEFGKLPATAKIASLRIVQVFPKTTVLEDQPRISLFTESLVRASLGTVPVEPDGSVYCTVPAGKEIYFQLLDEHGLAVQSMRSGTYLHPGELLSCAGCHESKAQAPAARQAPAAFGRQPSPLKPELAGVAGLEPCEPVNFYRLVKPVFDAKCAGCHRSAGQGPDMSYGSLGKYLVGFEGRWGKLYKAKRFGGSRTLAGQFGAHSSELYTGGYLTGTSTNCLGRVPLTADELRRVTLWLDLNSNELGAYESMAAQRQGKLVLPQLD